MRSDAAQKRSILVTHKNVSRLWLRAYPVDLARRVAEAKDLNAILPNSGKELDAIVSGEPVARWTVDLPATPDYRDHQTFIAGLSGAIMSSVFNYAVTRAFTWK